LDLCSVCEQKLPFLSNYCTRCACPISEEGAICGACLNLPPIALKTTVLFRYHPPIDQLIMSLKFQNNLINAKILGELFGSHLYDKYRKITKPEVIIPMPLHSKRLRERGYNQALELSRPIAKKLSLPIDAFSVIRKKNTLPQAQLSVNERQQNVRKAFCIIKSFNYRHVAIVDDVITTGNTIFELCKFLSDVGVQEIDIWCCAKSILREFF